LPERGFFCRLRLQVFPLGLFLLFLLSACSLRPAVKADRVVRPAAPDTVAEGAKNRFVAALLLAEKGDFWGAVEAYRTVQPSGAGAKAAVHHAAARAFLGLGVTDSARTHAEKAAAIEPGNSSYLLQLASVAHQMKDYGRAVAIYTDLVELQPGRSDYLTLLALEHIASGDPEKALGVFQRLLQLDPSDENTRAQVLLLEIKLKHYHEAIETLSGLIGEGEEKARLQLTLGELYVETGQTALASKTFREIIAANPRFVPAWLALLELSVASNDRSTFLLDLNAFYNTSGLKPEQKTSLAELFYVRAAKDSAYVQPLYGMLAEIEKRHPGETGAAMLKGKLKLREKKPLEAEREFRAILRRRPGHIEAWEDLITAYIMQKEYAKAAGAVAKAKKLAKVTPMRLLVLEGYTAFQVGDTRNAVRLLEKALQEKHREKERWLYLQAASTLAMSYDKLGLREKSLGMYRAILLLDSGNALAMNNYAYLLSLQGSDLATAKNLALKAVAHEPDNPVYLDTLGWVLFRLGEYREALQHLEKASALAPDDLEIAGHLLNVYEKTGAEEKARLLRQRIGRMGGK